MFLLGVQRFTPSKGECLKWDEHIYKYKVVIYMFFKVIIFFIGYGLAVSGGLQIIIYLNLIPAGFSYMDFLVFISTRPECYLFVIGIIMITLVIYLPTKD